MKGKLDWTAGMKQGWVGKGRSVGVWSRHGGFCGPTAMTVMAQWL